MVRRRVEGLTTIELLVVLSLLALLMVLTITQLNIPQRIEEALGLRATIQLKEVRKALNRYYVDHNIYPGNAKEAGINVIVPDELNHITNSSGNYYIQPTPAISATQALVGDKELNSAALNVKLNSFQIGKIRNFLFLAAKQLDDLTSCQNYVNGSGQVLSQPKVCKKLATDECRQIKGKMGGSADEVRDYYTICEAGGAMVAIIPLSGIDTSSSWYSWACDPTMTQFQYWIYYCK